MMEGNGENMYSLNCTTRIEGKIRISTIVWTVKNFISLLDNPNCREFRTDKFKENINTSDTNFRLKMQFLGKLNDIVEIYYQSSTAVFLKSILTLCLKRFEEKSIVIKEYHTITANKWQYLATLFKKEIASYDGRDTFLLSDGSLRLKFQFLITNDVKISKTIVEETQLSNDFKNLLVLGMFTDVVIKSSDSADFKVHKAILASRSPVFKALFEHNMIESATNCVESPLEKDILYELLTFIYSDKSPRVDEIPEQLLAAADYYQLSRLKSLCEEALHRKLTVENAIETLELADIHSAIGLKQMTLEFIKDGQAKLITQTDGWHKTKSVALIKTIYEFIMSDDFEDIK